MSPEPLPGPAFWASGGVVVARGAGPLGEAPSSLLGFLAREAVASRAAGNAAGADHCERMATALEDAIAQAGRWRRAAGGAVNSPHRRRERFPIRLTNP